MNHNLKDAMLSEYYEYSQKDIAEKMFLSVNTIALTENKARANFKRILLSRGINIKDILEDL